MGKVINIYKPKGKTPLETINKLKKLNPEFKNNKISYAGRLDPMAHGVLLLLIEPQTKKRIYYQNLDKKYVFKVLFGVATDSYDILGKITKANKHKFKINKKLLKDEIKAFEGRRIQNYPPYSSKTVNGKPLYWWARNNKLSEIKIPSKKVNIKKIKLIKSDYITKSNLKKMIFREIKKVKGDFRQVIILQRWGNYFKNANIKTYPVTTLQAKCSSGTYVRNIAHQLGKKLDIPSIALEIKRTKVGEYSSKNSIRAFRNSTTIIKD